MKNDELVGFNKELIDEVNEEREHLNGTESAFTSVFLTYLSEFGETKTADAEVSYCMKESEKFKVNAYAYSEYFQSLTLIVSCYEKSGKIEKLNKSETAKICRQATKFYKLCCSNSSIFDEMEESSNEYALYNFIKDIKDKIENLYVVLLTNKLVNCEWPEDTMINKTSVKYDIWDIERLVQGAYQRKEAEKLIIRFKSKYKYRLKLIKIPQESDIYDCYVGFISGKCLAEIYRDEGQRLIEKNVRSFLQATGKVNKGIRDTLRSDPAMFMAYNNGISTIAENVVIDENESSGDFITIKELVGWQIVNGGQTTASIYTALQNKVDLSNVNVQMKLTIIKSDEQMDTVISNISRYANSQNKITMSDFSANDDFHIELERLSRRVLIPVEKGKPTQKWFYERARGQYNVEVNRQPTAAEKRKYKESNPKNKCISKTIAAKCAMCWLKHPDVVSKGLETNFIKYSEMIQSGEIGKPDEKFYCDLIAQVIIFQQCDKIVDAQNFGGYKAQINYYTIALLSEYYSDKVNLDYIWQHQNVSPEVAVLLGELCYNVWRHFSEPNTNNAKGVNITQWCKKEDCWTLLKERFEKGSI
ncbi:MAG: AIPR family protein [Thermoguttaceae bacterium]|nr:AIPR family protein [Thermoguttaceae bacterium]